MFYIWKQGSLRINKLDNVIRVINCYEMEINVTWHLMCGYLTKENLYKPRFCFSSALEYALVRDLATNALEVLEEVENNGQDQDLDPSSSLENHHIHWLVVEDVLCWSGLLASPSSIVTWSSWASSWTGIWVDI